MKKIQVLGMGCAKCDKLEENAKAAADELGIEYEIEKIKDLNVIAGFGVIATPALVIDGVVKFEPARKNKRKVSVYSLS